MRSGRGPKENVQLPNHSGNFPAFMGATICRICLLTELMAVARVTDVFAQGVNDIHNILALPPQRWDGVPLINCRFGGRWPILLCGHGCRYSASGSVGRPLWSLCDHTDDVWPHAVQTLESHQRNNRLSSTPLDPRKQAFVDRRGSSCAFM